MEYIIIDCPFSSINDTQYHLAIVLNGSSVSTALDFLNKDKEVFTKGLVVSGKDIIYHYTGTLTGRVKAVDDEREDMFTPLVQSKLSFNLAVQNFPNWLLDYCNDNRAKVIVYYDEGGGLLHEMWRGYLIAQTLNMTVVNNLLSVALVAVDEVAMAKYMKFKPSLRHVSGDHWCSIYELMDHYHDLHHTSGLDSNTVGFEVIYSIIGLSTSDRMLWHCNLAVEDGSDNLVNNIPDTLVVNLDRWLQNEEATWQDVFTELFDFLNVTFAVGSYGLMTVNDAYILACPTAQTALQQFVYTFSDHTVTTHSFGVYEELTNPPKYGANLQLTVEPDRYKKVVVKSTPERWKGHDYLTDEHYKEIDENKEVRFAWGTTDDQNNGPFTEFGWHKMKYMKMDAEEVNFVEIAPCQDGEGLTMARNGLLPYVDLDSCTGKTEPDPSVADTLDFITFKEGCCCIKMGGGEIGGVDEDRQLKPYFLIMNHMWGNRVNQPAYTMANMHLNDTAWITFKPLGDNMAVHPSDNHYLTIGMSVRFIRENMPIGSLAVANPHHNNWFVSPGAGQPMEHITWSDPAMLLPCDTTVFNFEETGGPYNGAFNGSLTSWNSLYFTAYIRVGNFYFNGSNWVLVGTGETPPTCNVTMRNSTTETTEINKFGIRSFEITNYYYTISNPYLGNNSIDRDKSPKMLVSMYGLSVHNQPVEGQLEMQILGQIRFQSTKNGVGNSIPFLLINDVSINYTDEAEFMEKDIENKEEVVMDANSTTKETMEYELKMASPSVAGFFNNVLVYDTGKQWRNVTQVYLQNTLTPTTLERLKANSLYLQYGSGQLYVEFETPCPYDANLHNVCFGIQSLTEADGYFLPIKREFDYTMETLRVKAMRRNMGLYI